MDNSTRTELVRRYRDGFTVVQAALANATTTALDKSDAEGWTARQVVHHLADSEMTSALRLRKLLAEPNPVIYGYDEEGYSRSLWYEVRSIEPSLLAFRAARESTASILEHLSEEDWSRQGWHTESGPYSIQTWLEIYAAHAHDHAEQIRAALNGNR